MLEPLPTPTRLALLLLAGACTGSDSGGHAFAAAPSDSQQAQAPTAPVERARSGRPVTVTGAVAGEQSEGTARYDRVVFQFADSAAGYRVAHAAYTIVTAAGDTLATVSMDQRANGGHWQTLGSWSFPAGWSQVLLRRRDATGAVVVADAVRVR